MRVVKKSLVSPRKPSIAEYFCCSNTRQLITKLEKLILISFLISVHLWPLRKLRSV